MAQRQQARLSVGEPRPLRVGLLQTAPTFNAVEQNLAAISAVRRTIGPVDLAVTPELSALGYGFVAPHEQAVLDRDDPRLVDLASEGVALGFAERGVASLPWNSYLFGGAGAPLSVQRKLHPVSYAPWNEQLLFQPGDALETATVGDATVATVICNDMWHPIVPWLASQAGADVVLVPVASLDGTEHIRSTWETILRHTAILLQCYVVFVNRCGVDSGALFWGGSRVLGPDGETIAALGAEPGAVAVDLDLAALRQRRADVPLLAERRVDLIANLAAISAPRLRKECHV